MAKARMRYVWKPKWADLPKELPKQVTSKKLLTAEDVVDIFLRNHYYWFTDPDNTMYDQRPAYRTLLLEYLKNGEQIPGLDYSAIYAIGKFNNEWLLHFEKRHQ